MKSTWAVDHPNMLRREPEEWVSETESDGRATTVYRLFDAEGVLLYVGITNSGYRRLHQHASGKEWWEAVATATFEHCPDRRVALRREAEAIRDENPLHNIQRPLGDEAIRRVKGVEPAGSAVVTDEDLWLALERQARRHFDCSAEELVRGWEAGTIDVQDARCRYVVNLLGAVRVPVAEFGP